MPSPFDRAWARAEAGLDQAFADPLTLRPMTKADVNARASVDPARAVLDLAGVFDFAPATVEINPDGRSGSGNRHLVPHSQLLLRRELLPYEVRVDDVVVRSLAGGGSEIYRVATPPADDGVGRVTLKLARVVA